MFQQVIGNTESNAFVIDQEILMIQNQTLMQPFRILIFLILPSLMFSFTQAHNPTINPELLKNTWNARWITNIEGKHNPGVTGVFLFRKTFEPDYLADEFIVHVSADNRYQFYVNGTPVGRGPARSIPAHWNFETYDIAHLLNPGENVLAARVWNWGNDLPWGQTTLRTGLIVQGNGEKEQIINTGYTWKVQQEEAWTFFNYTPEEFHHTTGVGPCEKIDGNKMIWDWHLPGYDDSQWLYAEKIYPGRPAVMGTRGFNWGLQPSIIPQMDNSIVRLHTVVRSEHAEVDEQFCKGASEIIIPPHTNARILFDNQTLTVAIPQLTVNGGAGSSVKITYNEALYNDKNEKTYRYITEGMHLRGYYDIFLPDGSLRTFQTLWNRTYRFIELEIITDNEPLIIKDYKALSDIYPFQLKATFQSSDPHLERILDVGWRTVRTCALENYVDCPYYEQFQYFSDVDISGPAAPLLAGDSRLLRSGILQGKYSITEEGLTLAAAPGSDHKIIPFWSVAWIGMVYHYWVFNGDREFVGQMLPYIDGILGWYTSKLNDAMMLGPMPHWNFVDCTEKWPWAPDQGSICEPSGTREGYSSILSLQFVYGLQLAERIFMEMGYQEKAMEYRNLAKQINKATYNLCWDDERQRMADVPDKTSYSQHASIFAALTGAVSGEEARYLLRSIYHDESLLKASTQFQSYFHKALVANGIANDYLQYLGIWKQLIDWGFTTFPEYPDLNNRSDSHAWNAYPAFELFTIVCGIQITAPGFGSVHIEPNPGDLEWIKATLPWREDEIRLNLRQTRRGLRGTIYIPEGLQATYRFGDKQMDLKEGENRI